MTSEPVPVLGSTPTPTPTIELRVAMALNMLRQRPASERTCQLVIAVLQGKTLVEVIDLELAT
jgi:hypothetical protein